MARAHTALRPVFAATEGETAPSLPLGERLVQRGVLDRAAIPLVLAAQARWGCRFGEAAIALGRIAPIELAEALADASGLNFVDLIADPPDVALCEAAKIDLYLKELFLPWRRVGDRLVIACTDPSESMRSLLRRLYGPDIVLVVTAKFDITWTVAKVFRDRLSRDASFRLDERCPEFSARVVATMGQWVTGIAAALLVAVCSMANPALTLAALIVLLNIGYAANIVLRLILYVCAGFGCAGYEVSAKKIAALNDASLPLYTILAPLYREANMVGALTSALKQLDYPGMLAQVPQEK